MQFRDLPACANSTQFFISASQHMQPLEFICNKSSKIYNLILSELFIYLANPFAISHWCALRAIGLSSPHSMCYTSRLNLIGETHIYRGLSRRSRNTTTTKNRSDCLLNTNIPSEMGIDGGSRRSSKTAFHWDLPLKYQIKRSPCPECLSNGFHQLAITKDALEGRRLWCHRHFTRWAQIDEKNSAGDDMRRISSWAGCLWHLNESDLTWHNSSKGNTRDNKLSVRFGVPIIFILAQLLVLLCALYTPQSQHNVWSFLSWGKSRFCDVSLRGKVHH